jgi:hypothetical protein
METSSLAAMRSTLPYDLERLSVKLLGFGFTDFDDSKICE